MRRLVSGGFQFNLKDMPEVMETKALARVCGCGECPVCTKWVIYRYSLYENENIELYIKYRKDNNV